MAGTAAARKAEMETRPIGPGALGSRYIGCKNLLAHSRRQNHRARDQKSFQLTPLKLKQKFLRDWHPYL
jgi:hypothetical protein